MPSNDKLRICVYGRIRPDIAITEGIFLIFGYILGLGVAEGPNLIALDTLGGYVMECIVLVFVTSHAYALKDAQKAHRDLESRVTTGSGILKP